MLTRKCDRCGEEINSADYYEFTMKAINARNEEDRKYNSTQDLCCACAKAIKGAYEIICRE